jgi:hypothetical protein
MSEGGAPQGPRLNDILRLLLLWRWPKGPRSGATGPEDMAQDMHFIKFY